MFFIRTMLFGWLWLACVPLYSQTQLGSNIIGEASGDISGGAVSLSSDGTRIVIAAVNNDGTANLAGHARIFEYS
ncbi:MAG TPA: hypothetical protein DCE41_05865, partial [Cytophagales bacterium]|nr:hypothetical protein [Cytophagales bacterium]